MKIDQIDRQILRELQINADLTNEALGQRIHLSPATCQRRVRRLKEMGAIEKVVAIVNPQAVGQPLLALVEITLGSQTVESLTAFESIASASGFVQQCYQVSTGPDFILVLALPDMQAYHELASNLFTVSNGVRNVRSFFTVLRSKFTTSIPV
ncbi:Lrp/AsnC family transcriptional regulator [Orrella daihaiensis]|uniref:Lrp/AsnC family transcriptional regulator n=1 Tax=Orrella daihaiensis TaxID=2782176 RepID=A0ABY4AKB4_9BURK|nr:Lrp/AsnC family transcriptional regulator [Orrella daihaiensis]UOD50528.1 Lrp/AsnC family transcriptional regulator [Orrella daihaiensis]